MAARNVTRLFSVLALFVSGCSTTVQPPCPETTAPPVSASSDVATSEPVPVVLRLPPPPESALVAQKALPLVPGGLVRAGDGRLFSTKDGAELVLVPEAEFTMGDDASTEADERPAHRVTLSAHLLDRHEVTNAQFARFVAETGYRTDAEEQGVAHALVGDSFKDVAGADWRHPGGPATTIEGMGEHPVVLVSWNDAHAYCEWSGRRLPTEAEFERGLRAGAKGSKYPWGNEASPSPSSGNYSDEAAMRAHQKWVAVAGYEDGFSGTAPVGSFPQNALGLLDMGGNVWEWCSDWYGADYYGMSPGQDPQGISSGERRVNRGGGWDCDLFGARCSCRDGGKPGLRLPYLGFRTALSLW